MNKDEVIKELSKLDFRKESIKRAYTEFLFDQYQDQLQTILSIIDAICSQENIKIHYIEWYFCPRFNHSTKTSYEETGVLVNNNLENNKKIKLVLDSYPLEKINEFKIELSIKCKKHIADNKWQLELSYSVD